jgi:DNA polymerase (family 10)
MTNGELAQKLRDLRDFLIIAGYEESHATRYTHIARQIEGIAEPVAQMRREGRLQEIAGVGKTIQLYIKEILDEGVCSKQRDWEPYAPYSVVELVRVPGLGPKVARDLYHGYDIDSLAKLRLAFEAGALDDAPGLSSKLQASIREYLAQND